MHDGMPYGRIQGQGQGHSREVDRQFPTELILTIGFYHDFRISDQMRRYQQGGSYASLRLPSFSSPKGRDYLVFEASSAYASVCKLVASTSVVSPCRCLQLMCATTTTTTTTRVSKK